MGRSALLAAPLLCLSLAGCRRPAQDREVVLYTSLDETYSRPLIDRFSRETGIRVLFQTDTEATKTTGLVTKLLAERARPRCDVFWNNEIVQTLVLKRRGVLATFHVPAAADIPPAWKDPEGYWVGFAARARVIVYNTDRLQGAPPRRLRDLLDPRWRGQAAIARPLNGTTATHAAVLWQRWGRDKTQAFFRGMVANGVRILAGNAHVMRAVAAGTVLWGLTDTDDYHAARAAGAPVAVVYPDQDGEGTLLIPNTACRIRGGPHPDTARRLLDFLLRPEVEETLARGRSAQIPVRPGLARPAGLDLPPDLRVMTVDWNRVAAVFDACQEWLQDFLRGR